MKEAYENDSDGSTKRFLSLPPRKMSLVAASAATRRIRSMLQAMFGGPWLASRFEGDEFIYQSLREPVFLNLAGEPDWEWGRVLASEALPETLPVEDIPEVWEYGWSQSFQRFESELARLCVKEMVSPYEPGIDVLFKGQDDAIAIITKRMQEIQAAFVKKHGLEPEASSRGDPTTASPKAAARKPTGRHPVILDYATAQRIWWEMVDEYRDMGEARGPNQADLCERLATISIPMSVRTFRERIKQWQAAGNAWPPPRPTE